MAEWINKQTKLQKLMGRMQDHLSAGKVMASHHDHRSTSQIKLAILRSTSHDEQVPDAEAVNAVISLGSASRLRVSNCVSGILDRLHRTKTWIVALKCLILINKCLYDGGFMFQDQISFHLSGSGGRNDNGGGNDGCGHGRIYIDLCGRNIDSDLGGDHSSRSRDRNYIDLSNFKDPDSPFTCAVSAWIRWYARFIEQWLRTSRSLGCFLDVTVDDVSSHSEKLLSLPNAQLMKGILTLYDLLHVVSMAEELVVNHCLVTQSLQLTTLIAAKAYQEIKLCLLEIPRRMQNLTQLEASEVLKICEKISAKSMLFAHLFQLGQGLSSEQSSLPARHILFTDYELFKLKEDLKLAVRVNVSSSQQDSGT